MHVKRSYSSYHTLREIRRPLRWCPFATLMVVFLLPILVSLENMLDSISMGQNPCKQFTGSRNAFLDDVCFPYSKIFFLSKEMNQSLDLATKSSFIEPMRNQNWKEDPIDIDHGAGMLKYEPARLKTFENALVYRWSSTTFIKGDTFWMACERCLFREVAQPIRPILSDTFALKSYYDEAILTSSQIWGSGYYHYMTEMGFMLGAARDVLEKNPQAKIIVDGIQPGYLQFIRDILKLDPNRLLVIRPFSTFEALKVKRLHMMFFMSCGYVSPMNQILTRQWIRDLHPQIYNSTATNKYLIKNGYILVLDRNERGVCNRCLVNTVELVSKLQEMLTQGRRVVQVTLGELSAYEQMELFSKAELVIGPHGAGLTNMIYMPDNAKVLEIMNHARYFSYAYYDMAVGFGLTYRGIAPESNGKHKVTFHRLDMKKALKTVQELLELS